MKHLYSNYENEMVDADTLEEAARYHDCELGGADYPEDGWSQIADKAIIPIVDEETGLTEKKTAREWADEYDTVTQVATTYY